MKIRGFEIVNDIFRKTTDTVTLPTRGTKKAAAYDFYANKDYTVKPGEIVKIWTDIKSYMLDDEVLIVNIRSCMSGKFILSNISGWIDADYYENENNDGNIGVFLLNISDVTQEIKRGDRIAQGMFIKRLDADSGNTDVERVGGFGSTGKK